MLTTRLKMNLEKCILFKALSYQVIKILIESQNIKVIFLVMIQFIRKLEDLVKKHQSHLGKYNIISDLRIRLREVCHILL